MTLKSKKEYHKEYNLKNKERLKEQHKAYYLKNKEHLSEKMREYNKENRVYSKEKSREYYLKNKGRIIENQKKYYLENKEHIAKYSKEYCKDYYLKNKEHMRKIAKEWRSNNKESISRRGRKHFLENKEHIYKRTNERKKIRRKNDPNYKLLSNLRTRLWYALKGNSKTASTMELIGCSIEELWNHLESKFESWMTRENYGLWDVDHIIPCAKFDLTNPEQQKFCFHYTNLQPMEHIANIKKGVG
tara:strand:+ start:266 stop:1000 length:735 start_codon:yes stop_codon:yes gene_type:complete